MKKFAAIRSTDFLARVRSLSRLPMCAPVSGRPQVFIAVAFGLVQEGICPLDFKTSIHRFYTMW